MDFLLSKFPFKRYLILCAYSAIYSIIFLLLFQPFGLGQYSLVDRLLLSFSLAAALLCSLIISWLLLDFFIKIKRTSTFLKIVDFLIRTLVGAVVLTATAYYLEIVKFNFENIAIFSGILFSMAFFPKVIYYFALQTSFSRQEVQPEKSNNILEIPSQNKTESFEVDPQNILFIRSCSNYCEVLLDKGKPENTIIVRNSLKNIGKVLSDYGIVRCHRSYLVNSNFIKNISSNELFLKSNHQIPVSRKYKASIKESTDLK